MGCRGLRSITSPVCNAVWEQRSAALKMMSLRELKIFFDNPGATYFPDETVTGRVILNLNSTKKIRGIKLTVRGEADTNWVIKRKQLNQKRYVDESDCTRAHEEYFEAQFYLLGSHSGDEIELPSGTHTYPFNFVLPPNLPSSFEAEYGHVEYTVKVTLDRSRKVDQETKVAFNVFSHINLNQVPYASDPVILEKSKTFGFLFWESKPLSVHISLPVRGYVPEQTIPISVIVNNQSGFQVDKVRLILLEVVSYGATFPRSSRKVDEAIVAEVSKGPVGGNQTTNYKQNLRIPLLSPPNLQNCRILELEYKLLFVASISGAFRKKLSGSTVIHIGTVPLTNHEIPQASVPEADYPTKPEIAG